MIRSILLSGKTVRIFSVICRNIHNNIKKVIVGVNRDEENGGKFIKIRELHLI